MTCTYTPASATDITRARFAIADTDCTAAIFSDEEITFQITETGDWQHAVIALLNNLIARLAATADFQADWLKLSQSEALAYYTALRNELRQQYGVALITATAVHLWRPDSDQTAAPTFDGGDHNAWQIYQ